MLHHNDMRYICGYSGDDSGCCADNSDVNYFDDYSSCWNEIGSAAAVPYVPVAHLLPSEEKSKGILL
jgi:hypothetical protein